MLFSDVALVYRYLMSGLFEFEVEFDESFCKKCLDRAGYAWLEGLNKTL